MSEQFKTVGFWMTLTTTLIGLAVLLIGITEEQSKGITAVVGAVLTVLSQFGYLKAEAMVRAAKVMATAQVYGMRCADGISDAKVLNPIATIRSI